MGEIANMMLQGALCECCGVALGGKAPGYPRHCRACSTPAQPKPDKGDKTMPPIPAQEYAPPCTVSGSAVLITGTDALDKLDAYDYRTGIAELVAECDALQSNLDALHGMKFSDRNYHALKSRAEAAEAKLAASQQEVERLGMALRGEQMVHKSTRKSLAEATETWTDDTGTCWRPPTAHAYAMACRALHFEREARLAECQRDAERPSLKDGDMRQMEDGLWWAFKDGWFEIPFAFLEAQEEPPC